MPSPVLSRSKPKVPTWSVPPVQSKTAVPAPSSIDPAVRVPPLRLMVPWARVEPPTPSEMVWATRAPPLRFSVPIPPPPATAPLPGGFPLPTVTVSAVTVPASKVISASTLPVVPLQG